MGVPLLCLMDGLTAPSSAQDGRLRWGGRHTRRYTHTGPGGIVQRRWFPPTLLRGAGGIRSAVEAGVEAGILVREASGTGSGRVARCSIVLNDASGNDSVENLPGM